MEDNIFDHIIKGKLEQVKVPYDAASWQAFSQRMDALETQAGQTAEIDQLVQKNLGGKSVPFSSAHWDMLALRLERSRILIGRLHMVKVAEAAILLLTLLNLDAFQPGTERWQRPAIQPTGPIAQTEQPTEQGSTIESAASTEVAQSEVIAAPSMKKTDQAFLQSDKASKTYLNSKNSKTTSTQSLASNKSQNLDQISDLNQGILQNEQAMSDAALNTTTQDQPTVTTSQSVEQTSIAIATTSQSVEQTSIAIASAQNTMMAPLDQLSATELKYLNATQQNIQLISPMVQVLPTKPTLYISAYAGPDFLKIDGENTNSTIGYTAGISLLKRKGAWGIESGIEYSNLKYSTEVKREIIGGDPQKGFVGRTLKSIDFDMITIPLKLSRSVFRFKKTELRASAGLELIATAQVSPDYNGFYEPSSQPDPSQVQKPNVPNPASSKGLFEGGDIGKNTYLAVQAGLRLESPVCSSNKKLFLEINSQTLAFHKKLGPLDDSIVGIGLRAGVIASL
jgi:hypothetical protein